MYSVGKLSPGIHLPRYSYPISLIHDVLQLIVLGNSCMPLIPVKQPDLTSLGLENVTFFLPVGLHERLYQES